MANLTTYLMQRAETLASEERGAVGWLLVGIILGVLLIIFAIIKFLIPGD